MEGMKNFDGALVEYKKAVEMAPEQAGTLCTWQCLPVTPSVGRGDRAV